MITSAARIATESTSPLFCLDCGEFFSIEQGALLINSVKTACSHCGELSYSGEGCGAAIRPTDAHLIKDQAVLSTTWFHVSARADWASDILEPVMYRLQGSYAGESTLMVHLGSIEAARDRAKALSNEDTFAEAFYLYEVTLAEGTAINPLIVEDEGECWPEVTALCGTEHRSFNYDRFIVGATRYVNNYEAHGSVSIITPAPSVQVISRVCIDPLTFSPI